MITAKYLRDNISAIRNSIEKRKSTYPIDEMLRLDEELRSIQKQVQELQTKRNKGSKEISDAKKNRKKYR